MDKRIREIWDTTNWADKCILIYRYHMDKRSATGNKRGERWTLRDSSISLDFSLGYISEALNLARGLEKNPELRSLSRDEALRVVRR